MAYTSVLPVHRLERSIDYVKDRTKTTKSAGSLEEAIDYALNREKTEETIFEDAMGCTCENAYADMVKTKERFHKKGGVQGYHLVQSFAEGEVSPELAHLIGQELAEQLLKGQFEVVITTHLNTSHYHNHLVWNSVSMADGKKYHSNAKSYFTEVRRISDDLCRKYGLSVIQTNQGKAMHYAQWKAEAEGKPTWRTAIRMDIRDAIGVSFSWSQLKTPDMERYVRLRSLGNGYGEAEIREKILRPKIQQVYGKTQVQFPKRKLTGLQKLYFSYLYRMGVLQQKPKRISYAVRSDIRKLDLRIRQMEFLQKEGINTREELAAYRKPLEEQVLSLMKERRTLYRKEPGGMRIQEINGELKELRKKIRLSQQIEIQSKEMEERLKRAKEQEQVQESSGKQRREEERKR